MARPASTVSAIELSTRDARALAYRDHELFEYPGHAASLLTIDHHPLA